MILLVELIGLKVSSLLQMNVVSLSITEEGRNKGAREVRSRLRKSFINANRVIVSVLNNVSEKLR